jgi:hypothetical protein
VIAEQAFRFFAVQVEDGVDYRFSLSDAEGESARDSSAGSERRSRRRPYRPDKVELRDVTEDDLPIFYEHQPDPEATRMAAFPPIWRVPRKLVRDWSFRGYARTDLLIYGPTSVAEGASTPLGAFSQKANGRVAAIADKSVGRVKRILAGKPAYVALIAPTAEESYLAGHWSDCDDAAVVAAWTGDGRRVELTESVCETIT